MKLYGKVFLQTKVAKMETKIHFVLFYNLPPFLLAPAIFPDSDSRFWFNFQKGMKRAAFGFVF